MKECELCNCPARMYCDSDQASLCWDCDAGVHCANFLVERHSRSLLCHNCQSPTPWTATGAKLRPAICVCERCVRRCDGRIGTVEQQQQQHEEGEGENEDEDENDDDDDLDDDDEEEEDEDEEEEGENQVVPWSLTPPPISSSSCSEESSIRHGGSLKRKRENADLSSQEDLGSSSLQNGEGSEMTDHDSAEEEEATFLGSFRPVKDRKRKVTVTVRSESRTSLIDSLQRFQREKISNEDEAVDLPRAVDLVSAVSRSPSI